MKGNKEMIAKLHAGWQKVINESGAECGDIYFASRTMFSASCSHQIVEHGQTMGKIIGNFTNELIDGCQRVFERQVSGAIQDAIAKTQEPPKPAHPFTCVKGGKA